MIINRRESRLINELGGWILVYGRRKTGKTFLVRRSIDWDKYITIGRSLNAIVEKKDGDLYIVGVDHVAKSIVEDIENGMTIVIDEFQRLPRDYWDLISVARHRGEGKLILCGSSYFIVKHVFDEKSPLLGLFIPVEIGLIHIADSIKAFMGSHGFREAVLWGVISRDPWILGVAEPTGRVESFLCSRGNMLVSAASGLVGEVFEEEGRMLTKVYDAVLRLVALGYWSSKALAQKLYEARLIERPEMGIVTGVLNQLYKMGFIDKVRLFHSRGGRTFYRHRSTLLSTLLYIDEKYGEHGIRPDEGDILAKLGFELQFEIGKLMAEYKGLDAGYAILPGGEGDIDIVLMNRDRPLIGYEVKLGNISRSEARKAVERMRSYGIPRTGLISLSEEPPKEADENIGPEQLKRIIINLASE